MAQYDGSIRINTNINTDGIRRGESSIRGSMGRISNSAKNMMAVLTSAFVVGKVAQFGKEILDAASNFEAMESQFSQVFGELESVASESLSKVAGRAGIMEDRMKASFTKIAAFAKTTGMNTADSLALSERAMMAVADSAAFYDRSLEETTEYLQSFLKGNYENDAALGLSATEFTRNAAANKLYGKSFIELSEAQKQLTLLQMVEDANRLSGAMGQAAREADTWTNQTGNLSQAWTSLKANLGKFILPVAISAVKTITNVINAINAFLAKLYTAASAFRSFSELITGKKSQEGTSSGISKNTGADMGAGYNEAAEGAENLASANDKVAKSTGKAEKATKGQLSALDKLNNISSQDSGSGSGSGGSGGSGGGISGAIGDVDYGKVAEGETQFEKLGGILDAIIAKLKVLAGLFKKGFFEGLGDYKPRLDGIKKDILSIGKTLKEIFTDPEVVESTKNLAKQLSYSLGQVTGSIASIRLTIAENLIGGIEKYLSQNKDRIKKYIVSMLDIGTETSAIIGNFSVAFADIFSVFGGDTAQQITGNLIGIFAEVRMLISENALKLGRDILNTITKPIIENKDKIKTAIEGTLQAIEPFTSGLLTAVQTVRDAISDVYDNHLKPLFDSIANGLSEILGKLLDGYNAYMLPVLQGLGQKFKEIMEGPFGETVDTVKEFIGKLADAVKLLWENVLVPFFSWLEGSIIPIRAVILDFIGNFLLTNLKTLIKIIGNISKSLGGVIDFITGVFTGDWKKAWGGIKIFFKGIWDSIGDILFSALEHLINIFKNAYKLLDSFVMGFLKLLGTISSILSSAAKGISETISQIVTMISEALSSSAKWVEEEIRRSGGNIFLGMLNGILDAAKGIGKWIKKNIFDPFIKGFKNAFGIHSPSKVMAEQGGFIIDGIRKGITDKWNEFIQFWAEKKNEIIDKFKDIKDKFLAKGKDIIKGIKDGIRNLWTGFIEDWGRKKTAIVDKFKDIKDKFLAKGKDIINGIKDGIRNLWTGFIEDWGRKKDSITDTFSGIYNSMKAVGKNIVDGIIHGIKSIWSTLTGLADDIKKLFEFKPTASKGAGVSMVGGGSPRAAAYSRSMYSVPNIPIPALATGAVIPPNREFLAVLGDQKHGTNIEAPLDTIKKAVREEILSLGSAGSAEKEININLTVECEGYRLLQLIRKLDKEHFDQTGRPSFQI